MTELKTLKDFAWKNRDTEHKDRLFENDLLLKELRLEAIKWVEEFWKLGRYPFENIEICLECRKINGKNDSFDEQCYSKHHLVRSDDTTSNANSFLYTFIRTFFDLSEEDLK